MMEKMSQRDFYLKEFPRRFKNYKTNNMLRNTGLFQALEVDDKGIHFTNAGKLTPYDINLYQSQ